MYDQHLGSGPGGHTLSRPLCANMSSATSAPQCTKIGNQTCSKCHLVQYCSKDCQIQHWKRHRGQCKGAVISPSWLPAWIKQNRTPLFIDKDEVPGNAHQYFGLPYAYLWGNLPAIDCLNISKNEGASAVTQDFNICFAASGDIRNLVRTVNSLPEDYQGQCNILFNDINPLVVGHNVVVLWALLNEKLEVDDAVELALHLMYSSMLTPAMSDFLTNSIGIIRDITYGEQTSIGGVHGRGTVVVAPGNLGITLEMLQSRYGQRAAEHAYKMIMCNPLRQDYTDRYLNLLEPGHRLSFTHYRASGILGPFALDTSHFNEPNRLLYHPNGDWLLRDSDNPLHCWDASLFFAYGSRHGLGSADAYGCLFFYVKAELSSFAKRMRNCQINIAMTMMDAQVLSRTVTETQLEPFYSRKFDRIETSNLADYITAPTILRNWAMFLNRSNVHAAILMNFMNWQKQYPVLPDSESYGSNINVEKYAAVVGVDLKQLAMETAMKQMGGTDYTPNVLRSFSGILTFIDDHESFQAFLRDQNIENSASCHGLKLRKVNKVHPKRAGASLSATRDTTPSNLTKSEYYNTFRIGGSEPTARFVEFEACN